MKQNEKGHVVWWLVVAAVAVAGIFLLVSSVGSLAAEHGSTATKELAVSREVAQREDDRQTDLQERISEELSPTQESVLPPE